MSTPETAPQSEAEKLLAKLGLLDKIVDLVRESGILGAKRGPKPAASKAKAKPGPKPGKKKAQAKPDPAPPVDDAPALADNPDAPPLG